MHREINIVADNFDDTLHCPRGEESPITALLALAGKF
jgi:hypothetical protein